GKPHGRRPVRRGREGDRRPGFRHRGQRQPEHRLGLRGRPLGPGSIPGDHEGVSASARRASGSEGSSMTAKKLSLFEGFGIELEYMIVDRERLDVLPAADRVLEREAGAPVHEVEVGPVAWSNELVAHVIEIKTNGPIA